MKRDASSTMQAEKEGIKDSETQEGAAVKVAAELSQCFSRRPGGRLVCQAQASPGSESGLPL